MSGRHEDGGDEDDKGGPVQKPWMQAPAQNEEQTYRPYRRPIMGARGVWIEKAFKEALNAATFLTCRNRAMHDEF